MVEFRENQARNGSFGPLNDSMFVRMFNEIEDAASFYKLLDDINSWIERRFSRCEMIVRLKEAIGANVTATHRHFLFILASTKAEFQEMISR